MTDIYLTISRSTHNGDDTLQNGIYLKAAIIPQHPTVRTVSVLAEIRTEVLPDVSQERE